MEQYAKACLGLEDVLGNPQENSHWKHQVSLLVGMTWQQMAQQGSERKMLTGEAGEETLGRPLTAQGSLLSGESRGYQVQWVLGHTQLAEKSSKVLLDGVAFGQKP